MSRGARPSTGQTAQDIPDADLANGEPDATDSGVRTPASPASKVSGTDTATGTDPDVDVAAERLEHDSAGTPARARQNDRD